MNNKITFGVFEAFTLILNSMGARIFVNYPRPFVESAGTGGWIQLIYVFLIALTLFSIIEKLFKRFEGMDVIDLSDYIGGSILRVVTGTIIFSFLTFTNTVILREYAENMKIVSLERSPISFVMMFFLLGMVISSYAGLEALVRVHSNAVPLIAVMLLFLILAVTPLMDTTNLFPILGDGIGAILGGYSKVSIFGPVYYLFFIVPFIGKHSNFKRAGYAGLLVAAFFFLLGCIVYEGVIPYPTSTQYFMPMYQIARMINYGRFFQRIETVFILGWALSGIMYLSTIFFFTTYVFKKTYKLEYQRPLVLPFAIIIFSLSLFAPNLPSAIELETKIHVNISWIIVFVLTIIILLIANIKKASKGEK